MKKVLPSQIKKHFAEYQQDNLYFLGRTGEVNEMLKSAGLFGAKQPVVKDEVEVVKSISLFGLNKECAPKNKLTKSCSLPTLTSG